jgi:hypothetical protein
MKNKRRNRSNICAGKNKEGIKKETKKIKTTPMPR